MTGVDLYFQLVLHLGILVKFLVYIVFICLTVISEEIGITVEWNGAHLGSNQCVISNLTAQETHFKTKQERLCSDNYIV